MSYNDLARSPDEHRHRYGKLKGFEEQFRRERGPNLEFGRAAHWSETPRSGAKWSPIEEAELVLHFRDLIPENGQLISLKQLCELAWHHGRTAASIEQKLLKLLGHRVYYEQVHFHFH